MAHSFWTKKRVLIPLALILLLVLARLVLPYFVTRYVNQVLNDIPGYVGHVDDIDIRLWRGAYVIHGLELDKANAESPEPLLYFPKSDISIAWSSLLKGRIVSEIELYQPHVHQYRAARRRRYWLFFENLWEGFVGAFKFLLKNHATETLATRAPLEGDLSQVDTGVWATVMNILKNGWIQAFNPEVDQDTEFQDAVQQNQFRLPNIRLTGPASTKAN